MCVSSQPCVLIETLWNVNIFTSKHSPVSLKRINRNIVECKYRIYDSDFAVDIVLIETLWNVNCILGTDYEIINVCINRNIVECKFKSRKILKCTINGINRNIVECKWSQLKTTMQ